MTLLAQSRSRPELGLAQMSGMPWFLVPEHHDINRLLPEDLSLNDLSRIVATTEQQLNRLLHTHLQLEELANGWESTPTVYPCRDR